MKKFLFLLGMIVTFMVSIAGANEVGLQDNSKKGCEQWLNKADQLLVDLNTEYMDYKDDNQSWHRETAKDYADMSHTYLQRYNACIQKEKRMLDFKKMVKKLSKDELLQVLVLLDSSNFLSPKQKELIKNHTIGQIKKGKGEFSLEKFVARQKAKCLKKCEEE